MSTNPARLPNPPGTLRAPCADEDQHTQHAFGADAELYRRASVRPENELLLLCARSVTGGAVPAARVRELAASAVDWDYLYELAERHAVLPLLYAGLEANVRDTAPRAFYERLRRRFRENAARNLLLAGELVRITRLFESEGVPLMAYKGPALAVQAYGGLSLRRFVDLDVLVRREDARRAGGLLSSLGFAKPEGLSESHEEFLLRRQHNLAFTRDGGRMVVELHWEVAPAPFASLPMGAGAWGRGVEVELPGRRVRSLSPEDLLVALCVHGTKHLWERLAWVCDVAALLNSHPNLDWPLVHGLARAARVERMLSLGLRLAGRLVGASAPDGAQPGGVDPAVERLAAEVTEGLFGRDARGTAGFLRGVSFNLRARRRLSEKAGYLRFIFTPTDGDLAAVSLPAGMTFLYYLLRPFRLALKREAGH